MWLFGYRDRGHDDFDEWGVNRSHWNGRQSLGYYFLLSLLFCLIIIVVIEKKNKILFLAAPTVSFSTLVLLL